MRRNIFAICDLEKEYAMNFMQFLNQKKSIPFEIHAFTSVETLVDFASKEFIELLLVSDRAMCPEIRTLKTGVLVILAEELPPPDYSGPPQVYKYQAQDQLVREVMACYGEVPSAVPIPAPFAKRKTDILAVYTPLHRCLKTSIALAMGQILSQENAVLYVNLEEYSGFEELVGKTFDSDLADLIYYARQENCDLTRKLCAVVRTLGNLDYIPPVRQPWDIRCITLKDCRRLLDNLIRRSAYEVIILDVGTEMEEILDLLRLCTRIYMPVLGDPVSAAKLRQYEDMLALWEYEDLKEKTIRLKPPFYTPVSRGASYVEQLPYGELGDYIRKIL